MHKVELLAPAGRPDVLHKVIEAGADAVYVGGKSFNMRQHRSDFNFDQLQLKKAVQYAHANRRKLFITVNALLLDDEFSPLIEYLDCLDDMGVDAVIVQDLGLLHLISGRDYRFAVHASTMVNAHNSDTARLLKSLGVSRIVTSRDISIEAAASVAEAAGIESEYFIHGDMCVSQSGQCYHSGVLFGQSSNRGRCLKPCRWPYEFYDMRREKTIGAKRYYLARKDMCMIRYVDLLISRGITSLKIEGRMKDGDYLSHVVRSYRTVIDRYYKAPHRFSTSVQIVKTIHKKRVRDFSSCFALKKAGLESFGLSGAREPKFFSRAVTEPRIPGNGDSPAVVTIANRIKLQPQEIGITVHVSTLETLKTALRYSPSWVYVDTTLPAGYWDECRAASALKWAREYRVPLAFSVPSVMDEHEARNFEHSLQRGPHDVPDGYLTGNPGVIRILKKNGVENIFADYSLNVTNKYTIDLLKKLGVRRYCSSLEFPLSLHTASIENEILVHGPLPYMQFESCAIFTIKGKNLDDCPGYCEGASFGFRDEAGEIHEIVPDSRCRNYFMAAAHICLIDSLDSAVNQFTRYLRVDARFYQPDFTALLLDAYGRAVNIILEKGLYRPDSGVLKTLRDRSPYPLGTGMYQKRINARKVV